MPYANYEQELEYQRNYQRTYKSKFKNEKQRIIDQFNAEFPDIDQLKSSLNAREKTIIKLYYGIGLLLGKNYSLESVGNRLGITRQHTCVLKNNMLVKMRSLKSKSGFNL